MARLVAAYLAHEQSCVTCHAPGCGCAVRRLVVDVEFEVPPDATLPERIMLARLAGHEAAHAELLAGDA